MLTEHFFTVSTMINKCSYLIQQAISESYDKCGSLYLLNRCPVGKGKKKKTDCLLNRLKSPSGAALI